MNKYEGIVIFKPDLPEKDLENEYSKTEEAVKKEGGKVEKSEKWGKKKLAYPIKRFQDGFFLHTSFDAPPASIKTLTELFKLNSNILRAQFTKRGRNG